jgi:RHS repeat-associated protein
VGTVVPHQSWRGQFARGTFASGALAGQPSDCATYPPQNCLPIRWPGWATTAWHEDAGTQPVTGYEHYWFGSLAVGMRDASGQMYMRNRYYDPQTGQFTQPDPIGLAGGLNSYGFAAGDPVTYSDPYGLCKKEKEEPSDCEKFSRYLDALAASSQNTEEFIRTLGKQIAGFPEGRFTLDYVEPDQDITGQWGGSGFKPSMNDGDGHPWRHFTAFVVAGYDAGSKTGYLAAVVWEVAALAPGRTGSSYQDVLLGMVGARIGSQLRKGNLQPADVARLVRKSL